MNVPKRFAFGSKHVKAACLAVLATILEASDPESWPGQSAFNRGTEIRKQYFDRKSNIPIRDRLVEEVINGPTTVQALVGTTVVTGTTSINDGRIIAAGNYATAAQLDVRCPVHGGRVVLHGNRIINQGEISAYGTNGTASQLIVRCTKFQPAKTSTTSKTMFDNNGRIRAIP